MRLERCAKKKQSDIAGQHIPKKLSTVA
jgi:hypothetical protein